VQDFFIQSDQKLRVMLKMGGRLILALMVILGALYTYFSKTQVNPVTGEKQRVGLTPEEEIQLGLKSAPQMAAEFGGLHHDRSLQTKINTIGKKLVSHSEADKSPYQFDFHVLAEEKTINAFALPGGQVFITAGLLKQLKTDDEIAGVLGHEIGHVIGRHSAEQMAIGDLLQGLAGAAGVAGGDYTSAQTARYVARLIDLSYGRSDELESDDFGVKYMVAAGYKPEALLAVMKVLAQSSQGGVEFMSTHPSPANREEKIREAIGKYSKK
jgi:predicted Zn-dependent protease